MPLSLILIFFSFIIILIVPLFCQLWGIFRIKRASITGGQLAALHLPHYTRCFEGPHHNQGGKEKVVLVGQDKNTCGLVGKREEREGEPGLRNTHSTAGAMPPCLRVARAEGWRGNHHL